MFKELQENVTEIRNLNNEKLNGNSRVEKYSDIWNSLFGFNSKFEMTRTILHGPRLIKINHSEEQRGKKIEEKWTEPEKYVKQALKCIKFV